MFIYLNKRRGQSTLEYAVIVAVVVAGLIAMQFYIKRGLQGKLRSATDEIGDQFSPALSTYTSVTTVNSDSFENVALDGTNRPVTRTNTNQQQARNANENVVGLNQETW